MQCGKDVAPTSQALGARHTQHLHDALSAAAEHIAGCFQYLQACLYLQTAASWVHYSRADAVDCPQISRKTHAVSAPMMC